MTMTVNQFKELSMAVGKSDLTGTQLKVLLLIMGNLNHDGISFISQKEISEDLNVVRQNVNRAVRELVGKNMLRKIEVSGKVVGYSIPLFTPQKVRRVNLDNLSPEKVRVG